MATLGPWILRTTLSDANDKQIVRVVSKSLSGNWVVKIKTNKKLDELTDLRSLLREPPRNMVKVPPSPYHQFGLTEDSVWFAMQLYSGHLTRTDAYRWKEVAISCIHFLTDLHQLHDKVYMDFRMENILMTCNTVTVADYELVSEVGSMKTREASASNRWYYMARGAEPDQWLRSWRHDFVSLGYMLVMLTAEEEPSFVADFMQRRFGVRSSHRSTKQLLAARDRTMRSLMNPTLQSYFNKIAEVNWDKWVSPPRAFYEELEALFKT